MRTLILAVAACIALAASTPFSYTVVHMYQDVLPWVPWAYSSNAVTNIFIYPTPSRATELYVSVAFAGGGGDAQTVYLDGTQVVCASFDGDVVGEPIITEVRRPKPPR